MNGFLLDTNVPSELIRSRPDPNVQGWVGLQDESSLHLSVISIGELRRGMTLLPDSERRTRLENWLSSELLPSFLGRVLPVSQSIADRWGVLDALCRRHGTPLNIADGLIAATALEYSMTLVTRNVRDFAAVPIPIHNPWR